MQGESRQVCSSGEAISISSTLTVKEIELPMCVALGHLLFVHEISDPLSSSPVHQTRGSIDLSPREDDPTRSQDTARRLSPDLRQGLGIYPEHCRKYPLETQIRQVGRVSSSVLKA